MRKVYQFLLSLLLIGLFLADFFHPITAINVDLGRHLLLGEIIATTHHVPQTNLLSYTFANFPYINTSWLTDVMYHYVFILGGFSALLVMNTFFVASAFGLLVFYATKKYPLSSATFLSVTFYLLLLGLRSDIRPEVMSMLFLSLFMVMLFLSRGKSKKWLWVLGPLEILWVNMHIYFFAGPLLVFLFLLDDLKTRKSTKAYGLVLVGTLVATAINPKGIKGALFPYTVLQNYEFPVIENQSIPTLFVTYHSLLILLPLVVIILLFIVLFLARKNTKLIDWLLAFVFSVATIVIFRNVLLFVFTTFIPFVTQLNFLSKKYRPLMRKFYSPYHVLFYPISFLILFLFIVSSITVNGFGIGVNEQGRPAVDFLLAHHIRGPIYNNFDIGDYLSYRIYPQRVFVDNRPEAYPVSFFKNIYIPMQNNPKIFNKIDEKFRFNAIVISHWDNTAWGYPLLRYLVNNSSFKLIYLDAYTIIFIRNTPINKTFIDTFLITNKSIKLVSNDSQELVHYLFFFEKVGWRNNVLTTLEDLKKSDPELCILTKYPIAKTSISSFILIYRLSRNCYLY